MQQVMHYGVKEQTPSGNAVDRAVEQIKLLGYAVVDGGYSAPQLDDLGERFDRARASAAERAGGDFLKKIDEHHTIRAMLTLDRAFLDLACNPTVLELCRRLLGDYYILNQQNGVINPANAGTYGQGRYHRDLPYQHFVASRPLAINALFCLDPFTKENGATKVIPGSHKQEPFPSNETVASLEAIAEAPRGAFIVLDCMVYHSGSTNTTARERRAVNHVYTMPFMKQQIEFGAALGPDFAATPEIARLLDLENTVPRSVDEYYETRRRRLT